MFSFRRWLLCATLAIGSRLTAAPPLTTIQDVLYTADGNRFTGLVIITWKSFEASDTSNIAGQTERIQVFNGNLFVQLVPTTTAITAASYTIQYNSAGGTRFTEIWVVPPSAAPLRVRDVRLGPGGVTTPGTGPPQSTSVQISDVIGLQGALNLRPTMGIGFAISHAAVINASGSIDGALGSLADCLHVDGSSGPCGTGGGSAGTSFVDGEIPSGTVNGSNIAFSLANAPNPAASLALYRNGLLARQNVDYTISGSSISFLSGAVPQGGDTLLASYRLSASLPGVGFVDGETAAGSINGVNNAFTLAQAPNPATSLAIYRNGIRLRSTVDYTLSGSSVTFAAGNIPQIGDILQCSYRIVQ